MIAEVDLPVHRVRRDGGDVVVDGELGLRGITHQVPLAFEVAGFGPDAYGRWRSSGVAAMEVLNRSACTTISELIPYQDC